MDCFSAYHSVGRVIEVHSSKTEGDLCAERRSSTALEGPSEDGAAMAMVKLSRHVGQSAWKEGEKCKLLWMPCQCGGQQQLGKQRCSCGLDHANS